MRTINLAVIILHADLQKDVRIDPQPFRHGAVQSEHFVIMPSVTVMGQQRFRNG